MRQGIGLTAEGVLVNGSMAPVQTGPQGNTFCNSLRHKSGFLCRDEQTGEAKTKGQSMQDVLMKAPISLTVSSVTLRRWLKDFLHLK